MRLFNQRTAVWAEKWDAAYWIRTGNIREQAPERPAEDDPAVLIAREQIAKDGGILIVENVTRAVEAWRQKMSKQDEPT